MKIEKVGEVQSLPVLGACYDNSGMLNYKEPPGSWAAKTMTNGAQNPF